MSSSYVKTHIENQVGYIEFFHPSHNSLPSDVLGKLQDAIVNAGNDDDIKTIVLKSGGDRTFCAGASFQELIAIDSEKSGKAFFSGFANLINTMRKCPKFIIGRVQGKAVGGGVGLASATDYCLASKFASIKLSELSLAFGPFVIEPAVTRKIGLSNMTQLSIDATNFKSAEWAKEKGLFVEVFKTIEDLDEAVKAFAEKLATYSPDAMKQMKSVFWTNTEHWDDLLIERAAISGKLALSDFTKETLKRYK
ncbi:enoyl-CoA hydratase/isomerase family protein [Yeosuana sp. MJ-SS3]|uniref:Enoyl-CoA hydratase/isomerase family protein n=1 Tax=Gilvirhabdus luticola TaxID=3079858 RepID=A0ABU3U5E5_9FLAO|nr:enoyl-CoA hydratase/isomerase family protein [Yeosuana sp. MJ-SS3]MDU8885625.1 enoyl-CoA hydratase/isomerase family protein [Yeosuana sp. MJ-SS3]